MSTDLCHAAAPYVSVTLAPFLSRQGAALLQISDVDLSPEFQALVRRYLFLSAAASLANDAAQTVSDTAANSSKLRHNDASDELTNLYADAEDEIRELIPGTVSDLAVRLIFIAEERGGGWIREPSPDEELENLFRSVPWRVVDTLMRTRAEQPAAIRREIVMLHALRELDEAPVAVAAE